jgi:hypothetical protein
VTGSAIPTAAEVDQTGAKRHCELIDKSGQRNTEELLRTFRGERNGVPVSTTNARTPRWA